MDYGSINGVRIITGLTEQDIDDAEVTAFLSLAQRRFFNEILDYTLREEATQLSDTVFQVENYPLASPENGFSPTTSEVTAEAKANTDEWGMWRPLTVEELDAEHGLIKLSEAPDSGERVFVTYYSFPYVIPRRDIDEAVNYLAAALIENRLEDPGTISILDLDKNALVTKNQSNRFLAAYEAKKTAILGGSSFGAVIL